MQIALLHRTPKKVTFISENPEQGRQRGTLKKVHAEALAKDHAWCGQGGRCGWSGVCAVPGVQHGVGEPASKYLRLWGGLSFIPWMLQEPEGTTEHRRRERASLSASQDSPSWIPVKELLATGVRMRWRTGDVVQVTECLPSVPAGSTGFHPEHLIVGVSRRPAWDT